MKTPFIIGILAVLITGCNAVKVASKQTDTNQPSAAYQQQMENLNQEIYFRATGNEPFWSLKIGENGFQFTHFTSKMETFNAPPAAPIMAQDANVKTYRLSTELGQMTIQISQKECKDSMTGTLSPYSVTVDIKKGTDAVFSSFEGCGEYITDPRLHDIWALEQMNGVAVPSSDFNLGFPRLEINTKDNHFYGFAGCNGMSGSVFFERGLLRFTNITTTLKFCDSPNKEREFLSVLQSTTSYEVANMRLTLKNPSGVELVFKKVD